jgi:hypothetical protein
VLALFCGQETLLGPLFMFVDVQKHNHGSMISGFRYALGFGLSKELKFRIAQMHAFGLSPTQILQQYTKEI